jgi:hypothetical protein
VVLSWLLVSGALSLETATSAAGSWHLAEQQRVGLMLASRPVSFGRGAAVSGPSSRAPARRVVYGMVQRQPLAHQTGHRMNRPSLVLTLERIRNDTLEIHLPASCAGHVGADYHVASDLYLRSEIRRRPGNSDNVPFAAGIACTPCDPVWEQS